MTLKKFTLISLIIFAVIILAIYIAGIFGGSGNGASLQNRSSQQTATTTAKNFPAFSMDDVSKHNLPTDCWLVINSKVYSVSTYIGNHPGGADAIIFNCGKEVTGIFAQIHSNSAWDLLAKFQIGTIK